MLEALYKTFGWEGIEVIFTLNGTAIAIYNASKVNGRWYALPHSDSFGFHSVDSQQSMIDLINRILKSEALYKDIRGVESRQIELTDEVLTGEFVKSPAVDKIGIRSRVPLLQYHQPEKIVSVIDLGEESNESPVSRRDLLFKSLSSNVRRKINKAGKNGIVIKDGGLELLDDFYSVYRKTIHRHGSFGLPKVLFRNMLTHSETTAGPAARIFVAYNQSVIGSALLLTQNNFSENNAFATLPEYNHLYTAYALHMAMMDYAIKCGSRAYSPGRSTPGSGVHKFKKQFGGKEYPLFYCSNSNPAKSFIPFKFPLKRRLIQQFIRLLPQSLVEIFDAFVSGKIF